MFPKWQKNIGLDQKMFILLTIEPQTVFIKVKTIDKIIMLNT